MQALSRAVAVLLAVALMGGWAQRTAAQQANLAKVSAELNRTGVQAGQDAVVAIVFEVKAGYHAQSHTPKTPNLIALTIKTDENASATLGQPIYAAGKEHRATIDVPATANTTVIVPLQLDAAPRGVAFDPDVRVLATFQSR